MHPADIPDEHVYLHVRRNVLPNIVFYGVGVLVIALVGYYSRTFGLVLVGLFLLIVVVSSIQDAVTVVIWLALSVARLLGKDVPPDSWYMTAAQLLQLFELAVHVAYCVFLYYWFFIR
jgi:hypothetical protein